MKHLVFVQIKQLQIYVDTDDSVNNDGGVNEGNQLSPDEKLFIDVLVRSESESLEDRPHVQTSSNEVLFPDLTAEEIGFTGNGGIGEDNDGRDVEGVEQVHIDVEIGDNEGLSLEQPTLGVSGKDMPQINIRLYQHVAGDGEFKAPFEKLGIDIEDNTEKTRNYELIRSKSTVFATDFPQLALFEMKSNEENENISGDKTNSVLELFDDSSSGATAAVVPEITTKERSVATQTTPTTMTATSKGTTTETTETTILTTRSTTETTQGTKLETTTTKQYPTTTDKDLSSHNVARSLKNVGSVPPSLSKFLNFLLLLVNLLLMQSQNKLLDFH